MWAVVKQKNGDLNVDYVQINDPFPKANEVKIKVSFSGICGTDIKILHGNTWSNPPVVMGHEFSGIVTEVGKEVKDIKIGDRVVSETAQVVCGKCEHCQNGNYLMCNDRLSIGYGVDGAFSEYCVVRENIVHKIPENIKLKDAALCEPAAVAVHAVFDAAVLQPAQLAVVIGPGPIGLLAAQAAKSMGAIVCVLGTSVDEERLKIAKEVGADFIVDVEKQDLQKEIEKITSYKHADIVYECSGSKTAIDLGLKLLKKRGKLVQVGLTKSKMEIPYSLLNTKELRIIGSFGHRWSNWESVIRMLENSQLNVDKLVTHIFSLEYWKDAFNVVESKAGIKVLFDMSGE